MSYPNDWFRAECYRDVDGLRLNSDIEGETFQECFDHVVAFVVKHETAGISNFWHMHRERAGEKATMTNVVLSDEQSVRLGTAGPDCEHGIPEDRVCNACRFTDARE
jgi:hypothetical protein